MSASGGLVSLLLFGFWLGVRHAADADHVVAVSTFVARQKKLGGAWLLGAVWGLGHTVTIFLVGAAIILFKVKVSARAGLSLELAVAFALVLLGALNVAGLRVGASGLVRHSHPHDHDDPEHGHQAAHSHHRSGAHEHEHLAQPDLSWVERRFGRGAPAQFLRSLIVGLVHGLAGSAAIALLVLAAVSSAKAALLYLCVFGAGTLCGMLFLSSLMEASMFALMRWWTSADRVLTVGTGFVSLAFGLYLVWSIGFADGLFTSAPRWIPR